MHRSVIDTVSRLITPSTERVLDLEDAKKYIRFTPTTEDLLIEMFIDAATTYFESATGIICLNQTWEFGLSGTPYDSEIELPKSPLQSIESIVFGEETFDSASYEVVTATVGSTQRGRVRLLSGTWPTIVSPITGGIRIQYVAGFGATAESVPKDIIVTIGMLMGHFHKFRASVHEQTHGSIAQVPMGVEEIIRSYRYENVPTLPPRGFLPWV